MESIKSNISPLKQALLSVDKMQKRIKELENRDKEPIAIIGMGCRFPKCNNVKEYWELLVNGKEGIEDIPKERWSIDEFYDENYETPGKMNIKRGGFLKNIDKFDPSFFNISPREAERMDPQQRILLEVVWEMFESAGIIPDDFKGSNTGVFAGVGNIDYSQYSYGNFNNTSGYTGIGNSSCIVANRLSYFLDLLGPSLSIDTACSSSLVAVNLALNSLRKKECDTAIAAGVNLILSPEAHISFSKAQMMASDGRCKTFDSSADGYVRSEGCASILLKRFSDAIAHGDEILALIRGGAVNQDGRSNGLTAPNKNSQVSVIADALKDAGVKSNEIRFIEAHGTGTKLGDPIEMEALSEVFNDRSLSDKIYLGAVKSNIGHTEIAAGMAGLIKVVLCMQNELIPRNINFNYINPLIDIDNLPFKLPIENINWKSDEIKRIAGVSSFGFGGTNSHLILEESPTPKLNPQNHQIPVNILAISAKDENALIDYIKSHSSFIESAEKIDLNNYCYSANIGRTPFSYRKAFVLNGIRKANERLSAFLENNEASNIAPTDTNGKLITAFLFTGQGSQYFNMAKDLYETNSLFKDIFDKCNKILEEFLSVPIYDVIYKETENPDLLNETEYTQPALFVIEYCLAKLWQTWGIVPDYLLGHSIGEYVAAAIAEVFSLKDALKLVAHRAKLMQSLPKNGGMIAVFSEADTVSEAIKNTNANISVAALNGPLNTVISGDKKELAKVKPLIEKKGIKYRNLTVSHAFHSDLMEPILDEFERFASQIEYNNPKIPIVSNITGKIIGDENPFNAKYWRDQIRSTVRFTNCIEELELLKVDAYLEIGPKPILMGLGATSAPDSNALWLSSLMMGRDNWEILLNSLAAMFDRGYEIDWKRFYDGYSYVRTFTPTYPFGKKRYWIDYEKGKNISHIGHKIEKNFEHPLLGHFVQSPIIKAKIIESNLNKIEVSLIKDHIIFGVNLLPVMALTEMISAGAGFLFSTEEIYIKNFKLFEGINFSENTRVVQIVYDNISDDESEVMVYSAGKENETKILSWELNASCSVANLTNDSASKVLQELSIDEIKKRCRKFTDSELKFFFRAMTYTGFEHRKSLRIVKSLWSNDHEALGWFTVDSSVMDEIHNYLIHPSITDAGTQIFAAILHDHPDFQLQNGIFLPISIDEFRILKTNIKEAWGYTKVVKTLKHERAVIGDLNLLNEDGDILAAIFGIKYQYTPFKSINKLFNLSLNKWMYAPEWFVSEQIENTRHKNPFSHNWLIFGENNDLSAAVVSNLEREGGRAIYVIPSNNFEVIDQNIIKYNPNSETDYIKIFDVVGSEFQSSLYGILNLDPLNYEFNEAEDENKLSEIHEKLFGQLNLFINAVLKMNFDRVPNLIFITQNIHSLGNDYISANLAQAPLNGYFNSLELELQGYHIKRIDLNKAEDKTRIHDLLTELATTDNERQVVYRNNKRYVLRLVGRDEFFVTEVNDYLSQPTILQIQEKGILDNLKFLPAERSNPKPGMVEIQVRATGLNFRDVLNALDLYPGEAGPLGGECSGVITSVGVGVTDLNIGDEVLGIAGGSFSSYAHTSHNLVVQKPSGLTFEEAATIPIPFLTAYYALCTLAKIKSNDTVLIHAASGGVGLAAIQIAKLNGARIFGTAGSDEKRSILREEGVELIMNSRSLDFADEVMNYTEGKGVNILLNSLSGEYIEKGIEIVSEKGTFLEIGKIDIWDDKLVERFRGDISYHRIAVDDLSKDNSVFVGKLLQDIIGLFEDKKLVPIKHKIYPLSEVKSAFRFMSSAKHIGKIVVSQNLQSNKKPDIKIYEDASYMITGGTGGLGLITANWLIGKGAKNIILISRNAPDEEKEQIIKNLNRNGVTVSHYCIDISNYEKTKQLFSELSGGTEKTPKLKGIIHAAGTLEDGFIHQQNWRNFQKVFEPKINGAWNLHKLTQNISLDFMIYYSSVASIIGSPGQTNYAAANSFLDSLAAYRRNIGLPAICINWGPWSMFGMASREKYAYKDEKSVLKQISPSQGKFILNEIYDQYHNSITVIPINWEVFKSDLETYSSNPIFNRIISDNRLKTGKEDKTPILIQKLKNSEVKDHFNLIENHIQKIVKNVLGMQDTESLKINKPLSEFGIDSLMGLEIKKSIDSAIGVKLPATLVFNYPTIEKISEYILNNILTEYSDKESKPNKQNDTEDGSNKIIEEISELSDEEAEELLLKKLDSEEFDMDDNE